MKNISLLRKMIMVILFLLSPLAMASNVLSSKVDLNNGMANSKSKFSIDLKLLVPGILYNIYCEVDNPTNTNTLITILESGWTFLNDKHFTSNGYLNPGKNQLRVEEVAYSQYRETLDVYNHGQTSPITFQNCYGIAR